MSQCEDYFKSCSLCGALCLIGRELCAHEDQQPKTGSEAYLVWKVWKERAPNWGLALSMFIDVKIEEFLSVLWQREPAGPAIGGRGLAARGGGGVVEAEQEAGRDLAPRRREHVHPAHGEGAAGAREVAHSAL